MSNQGESLVYKNSEENWLYSLDSLEAETLK